MIIEGRRCRAGAWASLAIASAAMVACEDPARPVPAGAGGFLVVDSDPRGASIRLDGVERDEVTPGVFVDLTEGPHSVIVALDTAGFEYGYTELVVLPADGTARVSQPLTIRCIVLLCVREAAQFHSAGSLRFVVNGAGPLFLYEGADVGIVWPSTTPNTYVSIGAATFAALLDNQQVALGLRNIGTSLNYWAGRPLPTVTSTVPYVVSTPAWIAPSVANQTTIRGIEIVHQAVVRPELPDVVLIDVTWRNVSADTLYRLLDPGVPEGGVTYPGAYLGFILDADVGAFGEAGDDLASYSADRSLVFAYDGDMAVAGFTGGWSARPGLVGLLLLEGPGTATRLNAWPAANDFLSGVSEGSGFALLTAQQLFLPDHPDPRIGYAPSTERADYSISVASGPVTLAPGDSIGARFAVLLAAPVDGTFTTGATLPAGDPADPNRALAATAARLFELADSVIGMPLTAIP